MLLECKSSRLVTLTHHLQPSLLTPLHLPLSTQGTAAETPIRCVGCIHLRFIPPEKSEILTWGEMNRIMASARCTEHLEVNASHRDGRTVRGAGIHVCLPGSHNRMSPSQSSGRMSQRAEARLPWEGGPSVRVSRAPGESEAEEAACRREKPGEASLALTGAGRGGGRSGRGRPCGRVP